MSNPEGPYGLYNEAVKAALDAKRPCVCEHVDIGVGMQKVAEDPECPRCTREGEAAWYLQQMLPHIVKAERERFDAVLVQALTLPVWGEVETELVCIYSRADTMRDGFMGIYGNILDRLALNLVQARAKLAGDE